MLAEDERVDTMRGTIATAREAQASWAAVGVRERLAVIRRLRQEMAVGAEALAASVPLELTGNLHRSLADTLVSEVLPLLEACRFLEREAEFVLAPRRESTSARPAWLGGVTVETRRDPLGVVLVIGPGNYPLFLPGVQVLHALVAGNAVLWKPAPGGEGAALAMQRMLGACGLDRGLVTVLGTDISAGTAAMRAGVDKVVLTGSAATGRAVMRELAETLTPAVMELSGCDAVFVLDGAVASDEGRARVVEAVTFALRFNGSATCMAPRRLFVTSTVADRFVGELAASLAGMEPVPVSAGTRERLREMVDEATLYGAKVLVNGLGSAGVMGATLLTDVTPEMRITQADVFAPVLSVLQVESIDEAVAAYDACRYALTAAVFGPVREAEALGARLRAGCLLVNDLIVPTADPRTSFGGRGESGFGVTRGREGLLAMTAVKTVLRQSGRGRRAYQSTGVGHVGLFAGLALALHGRGWRARLRGVRLVIGAGRKMS